MKKIIPMLIVSLAFFSTKSNAQLQKRNVLVSGNLADLNLTHGSGGAFNIGLCTCVYWCIPIP